MVSLAALRYRNVLEDDGGPISMVETGRFDLRGTEVFGANATLREELAPRRGAKLFSAVDGSGTHRNAATARHIAVSEAIERWALLTELREGKGGRYGLGVDPTSNGMAAFPGVFARQARRFAWLEAVERYCLFAWWEGRAPGRFFETRWAGVSGVEIEGPFAAAEVRVVILFSRGVANGRYAYGHAAGGTLEEAGARALVEMCRHQLALELWDGRAAATSATGFAAAEINAGTKALGASATHPSEVVGLEGDRRLVVGGGGGGLA